MPSINNHGVQIHYTLEGEGPPLVLQHGFSDSVASWYEFGYVDALKHGYRLILVDARGHGASDKPHDPEAYDTHYNAADIVAVLDALAIPMAHFFGYSMGGRIGFALAKEAPARFASLIIGGAHPYPGPPQVDDPWIATLRQGPQAIVTLFDAPVSSALRARLATNDIEALIALRIKRKELPSLEAVLPTMTMPCLLIAGEKDWNYPGVTQCATQMPYVTFVSLPDLTHAETFFRSELVLPHVTKFLATVAHSRVWR
jgi:pimeloyl-ACP methyl ester carboxylesterase